MHSKRKRYQETEYTGGIKYYNQFAKNFMTMYGRAKPMPDVEGTLIRLQPYSCEWLRRPSVALSELSETLTENVKLLEENPGKLIRKNKIQRLVDATNTILPKLEPLNTKTSTPAQKTHVKDVLRFFLEEDQETQEFMEEMFHTSTAMYLTSLHYLVAKCVLTHPKEYAEKLQAKSGNDGAFKQRKTIKELKNFITAECVKDDDAPSSKPATNLAAQLESSEEESTVNNPRKRKSKSKSVRPQKKGNKAKRQVSPPPPAKSALEELLTDSDE